MNKQHLQQKPYIPFVVTSLLMWVALYFIFPFYQYYVDPDGTAYLTISQRYADGDWLTAINGLWSPWGCWLTALLIKTGMQPIPAGVVVNAIGAMGFHYISESLFLRFGLTLVQRWWANAAMVFFLCFAVFWQSFDDLWGCFFMLCVLRIMLAEGYIRRPGLWVATGMCGALAFFAKAYSLPYFILAVGAGSFALARGDKRQWLKIMFVAAPVMIACSFPWLFALRMKYGIWTSSTAGPLNMSWYLVGHPTWKEGIDILVPPIYPDSVNFWEDPWYVNGALSHYWDSWYLVRRQVLKLCYNTLILIQCMIEISPVLPLMGIMVLWQMRRFRSVPGELLAVYMFMITLPLGYVMVHLESRYLWLMLPLAIIVSTRELPSVGMPRLRARMFPLFIAGMLWFPAWKLVAMHNIGKAEYMLAQRLKAEGFTGVDFASNIHSRLLSRIMYFSGNRFFVVNRQKAGFKGEPRIANTGQLVRDMKRHGIAYYLYAPAGSSMIHGPDFDAIFLDNLRDGKEPITMTPVLEDTASGAIVYRVMYE